MIRMSVADLRVMGRNTQGVRLIRLNDDDEISSIARIDIQEAAEEGEIPEGSSPAGSDENSAPDAGSDETKE